MTPVTSQGKRTLERQVPYQIPTEVLGRIYSHVERPADFGAVNSTFRGVHKDAHFEKTRKRQLVTDAIRRNNGRIFYNKELARNGHISYVYPPGLSPEDDDLFFNESGCVMISRSSSELLTTLTFRYGESIKRIEFKAIIGFKSISNTPQFVPVGRFSLSSAPAGSGGRMQMKLYGPPMEWCMTKLQQNIPVLKTDLLRALRADLQNPCTSVAMRFMTEANNGYDYTTRFQAFLDELPSFEPESKTVMDVIDAIFDPPTSNMASVPRFIDGNAKIVDDALEVSLCFTLHYRRVRL